MAEPGHRVAVKKKRQADDSTPPRKKAPAEIPSYWKLTPEQQAFIESFDDDDKKE
jgi:hypothetical protein